MDYDDGPPPIGDTTDTDYDGTFDSAGFQAEVTPEVDDDWGDLAL
jgi:hypothetical protein